MGLAVAGEPALVPARLGLTRAIEARGGADDSGQARVEVSHYFRRSCS